MNLLYLALFFEWTLLTSCQVNWYEAMIKNDMLLCMTEIWYLSCSDKPF